MQGPGLQRSWSSSGTNLGIASPETRAPPVGSRRFVRRHAAGNLCGGSRSRLARCCLATAVLLKEVIQPHVPVRLPCYDFTPVIEHTVVSALLAVRLPTSGAINSHGVTGGVYKTRERIHRDMADSRLLAIPTSRSRVADSDPDYDRL